MAYQIYLSDSISSVELDCEQIDLTSTFSVADNRDISVRKDSVKTIQLKGNKTNTAAFAALLNLNRVTDATVANKLFFNYNPLIPVDAVVFEDSIMVFKGAFRITEVTVVKGDAVYSCMITGGFIDFRNRLSEKLLTDLDLSDLKHHYSADVVRLTWDSYVEKYDVASDSYSSFPFQKGMGYVYPQIDYGNLFQTTDGSTDSNAIALVNQDVNDIHYANMKPAVYVKEYMNRIFSQDVLPGFSYEIKGDATFINQFNSLIIPDNQADFTNVYSGFMVTAIKPTPIIESKAGSEGALQNGYKLLNVANVTPPPSGVLTSLISLYSTYNNVLKVDETFTSNGYLAVGFSSVYNPFNYDITISAQVVERVGQTNQSAAAGWTVVVEKKISVLAHQTVTNQTIQMEIGEHEYLHTNQVAVRVVVNGPLVIENVDYFIPSVSLSFPKDLVSVIKTNVVMGSTTGPAVTPKAPEAIKQIDFLKSLIGQFNMMAYPHPVNPKHIIFQRYDDYYILCNPGYMVNNAINWTNKIDFNNFKMKSNTLAKSYLFTYKEDSDFGNDAYKKKWSKVYGQYNFTDELGMGTENKVELIFSPSPMINEQGTDRLHACMYTVDSDNKKPAKTNIKLMYYNGLRNCVDWKLSTQSYVSGSWVKSVLFTASQYPSASNYYYNADIPVADLNFGLPNELYFTAPSLYFNVPTAYQLYYKNQITELTDVNMKLYDCSILLSETDIANLDLKIPVFIDLGENGYAYFKVLSVDYSDNLSLSKVSLQRIMVNDSSTLAIEPTTTSTTTVLFPSTTSTSTYPPLGSTTTSTTTLHLGSTTMQFEPTTTLHL